MSAIVVESLVKDYPGAKLASKRALDGVSFRVESGAAFGLIGPNGAGKTTLLKSLLGVVHPSAGSIRILDGAPSDAAVRRRIGYLPERLQLPTAWTAAGFLAGVARLKGLADLRAEVDRQLHRVRLAAERDAKIGAFSKGMRQRLGLAAALLGSPALLVLDEPTDGIDPKGRADVRAILQEERARGATLFLNSHLLSETERICDQIGILVAGKLLRCAATDQLCMDASRYRVRFAPFAQPITTTTALRALGFSQTQAPHVFACSDHDAVSLNEALQKAREAGALVLELTPQMRDLEAVLLDLMEPRQAHETHETRQAHEARQARDSVTRKGSA